jgi:hypothetical protein
MTKTASMNSLRSPQWPTIDAQWPTKRLGHSSVDRAGGVGCHRPVPVAMRPVPPLGRVVDQSGCAEASARIPRLCQAFPLTAGGLTYRLASIRSHSSPAPGLAYRREPEVFVEVTALQGVVTDVGEVFAVVTDRNGRHAWVAHQDNAARRRRIVGYGHGFMVARGRQGGPTSATCRSQPPTRNHSHTTATSHRTVVTDCQALSWESASCWARPTSSTFLIFPVSVIGNSCTISTSGTL